MKKIISLFMCIILTISIYNVDSMAAESQVIETGDTVIYTIPYEQVQAEHQHQLKEYMNSLGLSDDEYIFLPEGISLMNDIDDYKTEASEVRYVHTTSWLIASPAGCYCISNF